MKRIGSPVLALLMLLCMTGSRSGGNQAELETAKVQVQLLQQLLDEADAALAGGRYAETGKSLYGA